MQGAPAGLPTPFLRTLAFLLLLDAALLLPVLPRATLFEVDEGRISEVSKEMVLSGDWVTPRLGGVTFPCYPPLAYWIMGVSGSLFGWTEFAMRLPGALAGLGLVALVALATRRLAGERAGLAAAMILATLPGFFSQEKMCRADVLTLFFATLAFDRFLAWAESPEEKRRSRDLLFMYLAISLGVLAKGPIAIAVLGLGGLAWFGCRRQWKLLARMGWLWGLPLAAAIILPWYFLVYRRLGPTAGAAFLQWNLVDENLHAFTDGFEQRRPWHFYFRVAPLVMLPWLLALGFSWRARRAKGLSVALSWLGGVFLFLTLSIAKRPSYVAYMQPALAMSAGITLVALWDDAPHLARRGLWAVSALFAAAAGTLTFAPRRWWVADRIQLIQDLFPVLAALLAGGAAAVALVAWQRGPAAGTVALAFAIAGGFAVYGQVLEARGEPFRRQARAFALRLREQLPAGERLWRAGRGPDREYYEIDGAFHFYYGTPMFQRPWGEPGYYLLVEAERRTLVAQGKKIRQIDVYHDSDRRPTYLAQVTN